MRKKIGECLIEASLITEADRRSRSQSKSAAATVRRVLMVRKLPSG
jgi:hypothetical protein